MGRLFLLAFIAARYAADDVLCEPGTRSVAGQSECEQCAPGTYASEAGSTECYLCEPDTFAEQSGQSACDECPAGKYAAVAGLIDPRGCTDPSQPAWMYLSFLVDGVNGEALVSEAGFSAFAYAISDVVSFLTRPQNILDLTATFGEDDAASIEVVIAMDTCATFGHSSNEDCLDHGVVDVANAVVDGAMLERILYWADYFGLDIGDDLTVDSIVSDPEPYWVYAPTPAPTSTTCSGLAKKRCKKTAGCAYKKKTCISCSELSKGKCKKTDGCDYKKKQCSAASSCSGLSKKKCKTTDGCKYKKKKDKCLAK